MYITLRCQECENKDCPYARVFFPNESLEGCTREVSEDDAARYYFYMNEALPFKGNNHQSLYEEIMAFLFRIYEAPIGTKLNAQGKSVKLKTYKR